MGWRIFIHALRQVFGNLEDALRVSAVLTLLQVLITLAATQMPVPDSAGPGIGPAVVSTLASLVNAFLGIWLVVGWHRYILLNEQPGLVPTMRRDRILGYFGKSMLTVLIAIVPFFVLVVVLNAAGLTFFRMRPNDGNLLSALPTLLVMLPFAVVFTRLATMLPGAALNAGVPLFTGWVATRGHTGAIFTVVFLSALGSLVLTRVSGYLFEDPLSLSAQLAMVPVKWVETMVSASILTTLYGYYVERRALL